MKFLPKLLLAFFFFLLLSFSFLIYTNAEEKPFPPPYVPCNATRDPNFHSLRPYQASPCNQGLADEALLCANTLIMDDEIRAWGNVDTCGADFGNTAVQAIVGNCTLTCVYQWQRTIPFAIDVSNAELPIAGNTELVKNSQNSDAKLDDAQKVNEYVSWYLNGITNKAEEPFVGTKDPEDISKIVNFSGPLNKLLPQDTQFHARSETVEKALKGEERHDQIVGCTYDITLPIFGKIGGIPSPCYEKGLGSFFETRRWLSDWRGHLPPLRENFETFEQYWKAVQNWRGKFCALFPIPEFIPFIGGKEILLLCGLENPLEPNYYANLFPYIPLSSTEDRLGEEEINKVTRSSAYGSGVGVVNPRIENQKPNMLFFPHTEEISQLGDLLQNTFIPKGGEKTGPITATAPKIGPYCEIVNVRSNPGDNLFAKQGGGILGELKYTGIWTDVYVDVPDPETGECYPGGTSTHHAYLDFHMQTESPLLDDIFSRLVDGPAAIFRRLFPKIGKGGPIEEILDIPGVSKVDYGLDSHLVLKNVGDPAKGRPVTDQQGTGELYFPHLGSVSEYFLKGIQTLLRPKGYGEPILSGDPGTLPEDPTPKEAGGLVDCNQNAHQTLLTGVVSKEEFSGIADRWSSSGNFGGECFNDVIAKAKAAGVNPAYALAVWLLESGASNYGLSVEDFGVHQASVRGFKAQLQAFLNIVSGGTSQKASEQPQWGGNTLLGYLFYYNTGEYDPADPEYRKLYDRGIKYYDAFVNVWENFVAPGCPLPTGPLDNSCP